MPYRREVGTSALVKRVWWETLLTFSKKSQHSLILKLHNSSSFGGFFPIKIQGQKTSQIWMRKWPIYWHNNNNNNSNNYSCWKRFWDDHAALFEISASQSRKLFQCCYAMARRVTHNATMPRTMFVLVSTIFLATITFAGFTHFPAPVSDLGLSVRCWKRRRLPGKFHTLAGVAPPWGNYCKNKSGNVYITEQVNTLLYVN